VNLVTAAIDKPDAAEKTAADPQSAPRQAKTRARQKAAASQSSNPFAAFFGN